MVPEQPTNQTKCYQHNNRITKTVAAGGQFHMVISNKGFSGLGEFTLPRRFSQHLLPNGLNSISNTSNGKITKKKLNMIFIDSYNIIVSVQMYCCLGLGASV